ncbi:polyphenol oxidase [Aureimonas sp. Leaf454]|uniref:peptidoglycan editing factor PgeF n=1 Tax=Aureimonas sp. Leaf454 TaxID=1736381 RepID=UPI000700249C|nr:peptidoglycan editing factor PgeF [Aureimonas sp. Leaf454]KQT45123.1 polyphenol oxidase [Aureimonas sp. Leaf454]
MSDPTPNEAPPIRDRDVVTSPDLARADGVRHAFFTRAGGLSRGIYAGLNAGVGSKDDAAAVRANRARAATYLGLPGAEIVTPWQVHSPDAVAVSGPFAGERPKADAVVTATRGLPIGVVTADCGPVLFADERAGVVGAAHAGWGGAVGGVLESTIAAMEGLGARRGDIVAVLGPTITRDAYEVGVDRLQAAIAADPEAEAFFFEGRTADKRQFDLPAYILARLRRGGVAASFVEHCTYGEEDRFYSFRRTTHRSEPDYGRQLTAIALER